MNQLINLLKRYFRANQNNFQYYKDNCTFDFKGDIIVEAANIGLKESSLSVSTLMQIHTFAGTQLKIRENQTMKNSREYIQFIHLFLTFLFPDNNTNESLLYYVLIRQIATNTKEILVPYAEGLTWDNFDKKDYYNIHCNTPFS